MSEEELAAWLTGCYDLAGPMVVRLLRSYTNEVFTVASPRARVVLKIYGAHWRTESEINYEIALLRHLSAAGVRVAAPIAGSAGYINAVRFSGDDRHAVLFDYAAGAKPKPPFTTDLYSAFGRAIAQMHALSSDFEPRYSRAPLDLSHILDAPTAQILPLLSEPEEAAFLSTLANRLHARVAALASLGLEWGPIHGDATLDNLHVTADGELILYDFDSGGPGWRAADLQGWAANDPQYRERWTAFHEGYSSVRRLDAVNLVAAPVFTILWDIWGMKIDLDNRIQRLGPEKVRAYLSEQMALLRQRCTHIDLPK
jgi:Ser/Thr protein kinase RdoA (MazF antagonist)